MAGFPLACPATVSDDALTTTTKITGASSAAYTPKAADVPTDANGAQKCLVAKATYKDNIVTDANDDGDDDDATANKVSKAAIQNSLPDNTAPSSPTRTPPPLATSLTRPPAPWPRTRLSVRTSGIP